MGELLDWRSSLMALTLLSRLEVVQFYDTLLFKEGRAVSPGRINEPSPAATASDPPGGRVKSKVSAI